MKTRIISGIVAALLLAGLLVLNSYFSVTVVIAIALLAMVAVYEMLYRTGAVKAKIPVFAAMLYAAAIMWATFSNVTTTTLVTLIYVFFVAIFAVIGHKRFDYPYICLLCGDICGNRS